MPNFGTPFGRQGRSGISRYGGAQTTTVRPRRDVTVYPADTAPAGGNSNAVQNRGVGESVTNVAFDPSRNLTYASKAFRNYGIVLGTVLTGCDAFGDYVAPDKWADLLLPEDYSEGAATLDLPVGFGWLKLSDGSAPVGCHSWRSSLTFNQSVCFTGNNSSTDLSSTYSESVQPKLLYAFIDPSKSRAVVYCVFSGYVAGFFEGKDSPASSFLTVDSNVSDNSDLRAISFVQGAGLASGDKFVARINLSRGVDTDNFEEIGVAFGAGFFKGLGFDGAASERVPVFYLGARYRMVLFANTSGATVKQGHKLLVTGFTQYNDKTGTERLSRCQRTAIVTDMSSGAAPPILLSVVGGNTPPLTFNESANPLNTDVSKDEQGYTYDTAYPTNRPFAFPLPLIMGNKLFVLPRVKDWTKFDLAKDYVIGNKVPRLPDGLSYLLLERPASIGSSSWLSRYDNELYSAVAASVVPYVSGARTVKGTLTKIKVRWSRPIRLPTGGPTGVLYSLTYETFDGVVTPLAVTSVSLVAADWSTVLTYSDTVIGGVDPAKGSLYLNVASGAVLSTATPPINNAAQDNLSVVYTLDREAIVVGLNRNGTQGFAYGDYVLCSSSAISITDEHGVSRDVLEILTSANPAGYPHAHLNDGGGPLGGGRAYSGSLGLSGIGLP